LQQKYHSGVGVIMKSVIWRCVFIILINVLIFPQAFAVTSNVKPWTILIYMDADNNLSPYGVANIKDMERVGSNDQINIVTQWASETAGKAVRMLIQKDTSSSPNITSPVLQDLGQVDMGDYHNLEDFIQWGVQNFPAQHYFIIVWDHGFGWHGPLTSAPTFTKPSITNDISEDVNTGHFITTEQLGEAMAYAANLIGHKVDIYASDACFMAMAEVADQMKDSVNYFVGSQTFVPFQGLPYYDLLTQWESVPNADGKQVATWIVHLYAQYYHTLAPNRPVTLAAYDLNQLPAFNQAVANLGVEIEQSGVVNKNLIVTTASHSLDFYGGDYVDLLDFTNNLLQSGAVVEQCHRRSKYIINRQ